MDFTTVLRIAFSLAVVAGLLWLSYRVADRSRRSTAPGSAAQLTVVARQGLSAKSAAVLIDAGGTRYLLGVTDASVTVIDQGPAPESPPSAPARQGARPRSLAAKIGAFNVVKSQGASREVPAGGPPATTYDDAVLAAQVWLDGGQDLGAPSAPGAVQAPGATRSFLAADTWRRAARAVWGPGR